MKLALITDQHFGARGDSPVFAKYFNKFYKEQFFPYLIDQNIKNVIMLGDTYDRRKYTAHATIKNSKDNYFNPLLKMGINLHVIIGNHDITYKNTNAVNSVQLFLNEYNNVTPYMATTEITIDKCKILLVPWICEDNYDASIKMIVKTEAQILFGHLELSGFEMYKGSVIDHGMDRSIFSKFEIVCSGHYHHRSSLGNIHYLGCPYEMTWADYNDPKGFHTFDTQTRELTFVPNPYAMFHKLIYDDEGKVMDDIMSKNCSQYKDAFVKVVVKNKNNPYWFDLFIDKLEKAETTHIQIVDDNLNLNLYTDENIINEAEDTLTILKNYVNDLELNENKAELNLLMRELYEEACSLE